MKLSGKHSLKIVLVDEYYPCLTALSYALASHGHECECFVTVTEALPRIASWHPDAVVYEWNLRDGAGRGLATRFRAASASVKLVIAMSSLEEPEGFVELEQVDAYLVKPFETWQLERLLGGEA